MVDLKKRDSHSQNKVLTSLRLDIGRSMEAIYAFAAELSIEVVTKIQILPAVLSSVGLLPAVQSNKRAPVLSAQCGVYYPL